MFIYIHKYNVLEKERLFFCYYFISKMAYLTLMRLLQLINYHQWIGRWFQPLYYYLCVINMTYGLSTT